MVGVTGSWTNQSCAGNEILLFEPSNRTLGPTQVAPDPPWPKDGGCQVAMVGVTGSRTNQSYPGDGYLPFEPSSSPLGHSEVAPDPPWPQDGAARWPWSGLKGQVSPKAVQGMTTDHLSHLAALYVTPKWLQTLPSFKMGLPGGHGRGYGVKHKPQLSRG